MCIRDRIVDDHGDGLALATVQVAHEGHEVVAGADVQIGGGLVKHDEVGVLGERAGQMRPLALAAGELVQVVAAKARDAGPFHSGLHGRAIVRAEASSPGQVGMAAAGHQGLHSHGRQDVYKRQENAVVCASRRRWGALAGVRHPLRGRLVLLQDVYKRQSLPRGANRRCFVISKPFWTIVGFVSLCIPMFRDFQANFQARLIACGLEAKAGVFVWLSRRRVEGSSGVGARSFHGFAAERRSVVTLGRAPEAPEALPIMSH